VESMMMSFTLDNVALSAATYAAFDLEEFMALEMRSLMETSLVLPCLISNMRAVYIPRLSVGTDNIGDLEIVGLLPPSSKHSKLQKISGNVFDVSRRELIQSLPKIFDTTIRESINTYLSDTLRSDPVYCSFDVSSMGGVIDFRDLLLPAEKARALGGSGMEPYGNTFSLLFDPSTKVRERHGLESGICSSMDTESIQPKRESCPTGSFRFNWISENQQFRSNIDDTAIQR